MIKIKNLKFYYENFFMNIDFKIKKGERVALLGHSGSGKSTLLDIISGFKILRYGTILLADNDHTHTHPYKRPVSILFQDNNLFPHLTVFQNIILGIAPNLRLNKNQYTLVNKIIKEVSLNKYLHHLPSAISGGQRQRAALARCLIRQKPILLLDEPFSSLDPVLRSEMLSLVKKICDKNKLTLLIVSHDLNAMVEIVSRAIVISNGHIIFDDQLFYLLHGLTPVSNLFGITYNK